MKPPPDKRVDLSALSAWAPQLAEAFVSLASDIALVLDENGVVLNVAQGGAAPVAPSAHEWVGRAWVDTVTGDTRAKVGLLLKDVTSTGFARRREVNHPSSAGADIPVAYTAMRLGEHGPVLVVGRDLGPWPRFSSASSMCSAKWNAATGAPASPKRASGCCSRWPTTR
jgi:hypothetical protein